MPLKMYKALYPIAKSFIFNIDFNEPENESTPNYTIHLNGKEIFSLTSPRVLNITNADYSLTRLDGEARQCKMQYGDRIEVWAHVKKYTGYSNTPTFNIVFKYAGKKTATIVADEHWLSGVWQSSVDVKIAAFALPMPQGWYYDIDAAKKMRVNTDTYNVSSYPPCRIRGV